MEKLKDDGNTLTPRLFSTPVQCWHNNWVHSHSSGDCKGLNIDPEESPSQTNQAPPSMLLLVMSSPQTQFLIQKKWDRQMS